VKRRILIALLLLASINIYAQTKFGITAGLQFSNVKIENVDPDNRMSFNTGVTSLMSVSEGVDFNAQLLLSGKGFTYNDSYGYKNVIRPLYLELPLVFRFNFETSMDTKLFIGAGGYYAFGIGGNKIFYNNGYKETEKVKFGSTNNDDLESSDAGLVFQLGGLIHENYEGHFFYDMGLTKIIPNTTTESNNRVFGFNLSWLF
jgi:hypothetical protein